MPLALKLYYILFLLSFYGESKVNFVNILDELKLPYILAIRSNHALWLPQDQEVYQEPWQKFEHTFSNGSTETRYMAEVIYGKRHRKQYWLLTTDLETLPNKALLNLGMNFFESGAQRHFQKNSYIKSATPRTIPPRSSWSLPLRSSSKKLGTTMALEPGLNMNSSKPKMRLVGQTSA